jgi:hypothetical protein
VKARQKIDEIVAKFDQLSDDAIVPDEVSAKVLGTSPWTLRRNRLLTYRRISERFKGHRVGDVRAVSRGELARPSPYKTPL